MNKIEDESAARDAVSCHAPTACEFEAFTDEAGGMLGWTFAVDSRHETYRWILAESGRLGSREPDRSNAEWVGRLIARDVRRNTKDASPGPGGGPAVVALQEVHDLTLKCVLADGKAAHAVQANLDGEWPATWYQGAGPDFSTLILAGPEGPNFNAGTPERAAFVVLNEPVHVLGLVDYLRWTCSQHEPVLMPAEQDGQTVPMMVCPIDGEECESLLRVAEIFADRPGYKREWRL
ncbi:DUF6221 family protein [Streptomyces atroolivaceus]|uniref:DUF6221 family protein n=1 Tax=Streptomyces atroolivaceus TaxID=66869 RepID=UPI0020253152|nr:DUF6221 family protein [Streptomyces atroolivaceus]